MAEPQKHPRTPYLHIRSVEGLLGEVIAVTGNAAALLKLRAQIERALKGEDSYPFEEGVYVDIHEQPFEVVVKRARSKREMQEPGPKPEKTADELPWAEVARRTKEETR